MILAETATALLAEGVYLGGGVLLVLIIIVIVLLVR